LQGTVEKNTKIVREKSEKINAMFVLEQFLHSILAENEQIGQATTQIV